MTSHLPVRITYRFPPIQYVGLIDDIGICTAHEPGNLPARNLRGQNR
ncbi:hypothetical protein [Aeromicrobium sp.]